MRGFVEFIDEIRSLKDQLLFEGTFRVPKNIEHVVIAGMGGSGIGGKIFTELYTKTQISLVDDYDIPDFVDRDTLFIGVSYSGNTEETISALQCAKKKGAHTVAITSGGALSNIAQQTVIIPKGLQPRSALGYMLMPLVNSFNVVSHNSIKEAYGLLEGIDRDNDEERSIAREISAKNAIPVVYGARPYKAVAYSWKVQKFNETAKVMGCSSSFPELNHNENLALKETYRKKEFYFMVLTDGRDERINRRIKATEKLTGTKFKMIKAEGNSTFARTMALVQKGNYISYHLAKYRGKDPKDVSLVEELKKALRQR